MSLQLDEQLMRTGTRFLLFPQPRFLRRTDGTPLFPTPETVAVSVPPADIQPGPADDRMFVVDAIGKLPYKQFTGPPWRGLQRPPVQPGEDGHFTHLDPDSREFSAATMYATVRRVLDIWQDYFGHRIDWSFESDFARLELIPLIEWDNAQSGFGFLEFGFGRTVTGTIDHTRPFCENFDVLAHELGHSIIFSEVGVPSSPLDAGIDYGGFQESCGDLTAIIALLHFRSFVDQLLTETKGNLLTVNGLDRVGELSDSREIRVALNSKRMSDVGQAPHVRSLPLTGAVFDTMVEIFQKALVARGLITQDLRDASNNIPSDTVGLDPDEIQRQFTAAYTGAEEEFTNALLEARDATGRLLATTWGQLSPDFLTYHEVLRGLVRADRELTDGDNQQIIRDSFAWREISPVPDSLLLRPRKLEDCGLRTADPADVSDATRRVVAADDLIPRPRGHAAAVEVAPAARR
ncbi:conserved protein of unknown function [Modestobacter italicus]|uniref:Peptidase M4 family protein n=1 Tax=Modestobacter italicus (strain DSM 44449 / CECT 9708 / BC 501) TaxID=2732864 RepID=I4EX38_MODI5|nr:hypothetical protein [Modestobacter marinus]CCH87951.1 conserved protein of unknown function [Modestobacter marinus]